MEQSTELLTPFNEPWGLPGEQHSCGSTGGAIWMHPFHIGNVLWHSGCIKHLEITSICSLTFCLDLTFCRHPLLQFSVIFGLLDNKNSVLDLVSVFWSKTSSYTCYVYLVKLWMKCRFLSVEIVVIFFISHVDYYVSTVDCKTQFSGVCFIIHNIFFHFFLKHFTQPIYHLSISSIGPLFSPVILSSCLPQSISAFNLPLVPF